LIIPLRVLFGTQTVKGKPLNSKKVLDHPTNKEFLGANMGKEEVIEPLFVSLRVLFRTHMVEGKKTNNRKIPRKKRPVSA
jgi:hypothetical protein